MGRWGEPGSREPSGEAREAAENGLLEVRSAL